jgi:transposase
MDAHGKVLDTATLDTNGRLLVGYLRGVAGEKTLTFEECELSSWLYEILKKEVDELVVCNPVENRAYKKAKTDKLDARNLANLLRGGYLSSVYHDGSDREKFRDLMSGYQALVDDAVRIKNRYKSLFRKEGKTAKGATFYSDESLLDGLKRDDFRFIGGHMYHVLEEMEKSRQAYLVEIKKYCRKFKEIKYLKTLPGIADIQAAKIVAQVIDPCRFENKYKYFSYCGLVRHQQISGERSYGDKKIWGNRVLKCVYKMAAKSAIGGNSGLRKYYDNLRGKGIGDKSAKNAVSRKIAAISLVLWKKSEKYCDETITNGLIG